MKICISFFLILAITVGFLAGCWSAKPTDQSLNKSTVVGQTNSLDDDLFALFNNLQTTKQTNNLKLLNNYLFESLALHDSADISMTAQILQALREGRTNELINVLEGNLNSAIMAFGSDYRNVDRSKRDKGELKSLQFAYNYRTKFPHDDPKWESRITNAFKLLDENAK
ncbi:MAG TPA: hypothetical protein VIK53_04635 [Verrucomicrobiae bacterium]